MSMNVFAYSYDGEIRDSNDTELKYNISYNYADNGQWDLNSCTYKKIKCMDELKEVWSNTEKYDESFFENYFLLVINYGVANSTYELHVTSVTDESDTINIMLDTLYVGGVSLEMPIECQVVLEMDRKMIDKIISIQTREEILWRLTSQYYEGCFSNQQDGTEIKPYITKIDSAEKMDKYFGEAREELINEYSDSYFKNGNYLIAINWVESSSVRMHEITSVYYDADSFDVILSTINIKDEGYAVQTPWCAIIPISSNWGNASYKLILVNNEDNLSTPEQDKDYPYEIQNISITNAAGEILNSVPDNTGFIVDINLNKVKERNSKDYLFVAVYDTDGALISLDYVKANFAVGNDYSFGFNVPVQDKAIGSIKAYVWSSFSDMEALADTKTLSFQ